MNMVSVSISAMYQWSEADTLLFICVIFTIITLHTYRDQQTTTELKTWTEVATEPASTSFSFVTSY